MVKKRTSKTTAPVRIGLNITSYNSIDYTLLLCECIKRIWPGGYEIVITDNSDNDDVSKFEYAKELFGEKFILDHVDENPGHLQVSPTQSKGDMKLGKRDIGNG